MDLQYLETILAIAEEGSVSKAAERLFITQPAITHQLLKLEQELGAPLFIRSGRKLELTEAGEVYVEHARKVAALKREAYARIAEVRAKQQRTLSIGFTPARGIEMFSHIYPRFHARYPDTHVIPREVMTLEMQRMIAEGYLDLGFVSATQAQRDARNSYVVLWEEELSLVIAKTYPLRHQLSEPVDIRLLREAPFVLLQRNSTVRIVTDEFFRRADFVPHVLFETHHTPTILTLIQQGVCCGIIPKYYTHQADSSLAVYTLDGRPSISTCACFRKNRPLSAQDRCFIELAGEFLSRSNGLRREADGAEPSAG